MDGITTLQDIVIIAATNRPDMVDSAVLRPGRFDRLIYVPEPDEKSRLQILKIYTKGMPISKDVDLNQITIATKYYSGADYRIPLPRSCNAFTTKERKLNRSHHERFPGCPKRNGSIDYA